MTPVCRRFSYNITLSGDKRNRPLLLMFIGKALDKLERKIYLLVINMVFVHFF